jgi:uncharacterized SAM-binding protein YcdF (DUF218 family)
MKLLGIISAIIMINSILLYIVLLTVGGYLAPVDRVEYADAIIVVSGGGDERLEKGIDLMLGGYAEVLVLSGDARDPESPSNAEVMKAQAIQSGVDPEKILLENESKTTYENAYYVRKLLEEHGVFAYDRLILVTTSYHQRRLLQSFEEMYHDKPEIEFINQPADVAFWSENTWFLNKKGIDLTFGEFVKIIWGKLTGQLTG